MSNPEQAPIMDGELDGLFAPLGGHACITIGVSGGADSMALMYLAARWRDLMDGDRPRIIVLTVDHGIRAESRDEAKWVGERAEALGLDHEILVWLGEKPGSGLQDAAREARYGLMIEVMKREESTALIVAHHLEDQGETLLMRLARGSGVDGLAGMAPVVGRSGIQIYRPFLGLSKMRLRATLAASGKSWLEDPSNENREFERIRVREVLGSLQPLGILPASLGRSMQRLRRARVALEEAARGAVGSFVDFHGGAYGGIDGPAFFSLPEEIRLRVLGAVIAALGGRRRVPQMAKLETALLAVEKAKAQNGACSTSLGGALVRYEDRNIRIFREPLRGDIAELPIEPGGAPIIWDGRFEITAEASAPQGLWVRPLGEKGIRDMGELGFRAENMPREAMLALPGFWLDGRIIVVSEFVALANLCRKVDARVANYPLQLRFIGARELS